MLGDRDNRAALFGRLTIVHLQSMGRRRWRRKYVAVRTLEGHGRRSVGVPSVPVKDASGHMYVDAACVMRATERRWRGTAEGRWEEGCSRRSAVNLTRTKFVPKSSGIYATTSLGERDPPPLRAVQLYNHVCKFGSSDTCSVWRERRDLDSRFAYVRASSRD